MKPATKGAIWIIGAMALIAMGDNFTPLVTDYMGLWQFHALRSTMVILVVLLIAGATGRMAAVWPGSVRRCGCSTWGAGSASTTRADSAACARR